MSDNKFFDSELNEESLDFEIRKSFEDEFDAEDLFVSEDLIARTMAAIQKADTASISSDSQENNKDTDIDKVTDITDKTNRKSIIKVVYGIAAALIIGVIGIAIFKMAGGIKKSEDKADFVASSNAVSSERYESATESSVPRYKDEEKSSSSSVKQETNASAGSYDSLKVTDSVADSKYYNSSSLKGDIKTSEDSMEIDMKNPREDYEGLDFTASEQADESYNEATTDTANSDGGAIKTDDVDSDSETPTYSGISEEAVLEDISDIVEQIGFTEEKEMPYTDENMRKIHGTAGYQHLMSYGDEVKAVLEEIYDKGRTGEGMEAYMEYAPLAQKLNVIYMILQEMEG